MAVAAENVLSGKDDFLIRDVDKDSKAYDARKRHRHGDRVDAPILPRFDQLRLAKEEKDDGFLCIANAHRLVILIEDEHFAAQLAARMWDIVRTEDPATSLRYQKFNMIAIRIAKYNKFPFLVKRETVP